MRGRSNSQPAPDCPTLLCLPFCSDKTPAALFFRYNTQLGPPYQVGAAAGPLTALLLRLFSCTCVAVSAVVSLRVALCIGPPNAALSRHSPHASPRQVIIDTNFINFSIRNKIDLVKVCAAWQCRVAVRLLCGC